MAISAAPFATFLIVGPTCFFLGILFGNFPYDYNVIWTTPPAVEGLIDPREPYYQILETHLKFIHASPPLISRILHIVMGTGLLGFMLKLYKMSESNMLFDGASLVLYMIGVIVYITNIVKGLRIVTEGKYGETMAQYSEGDVIGREDSLKVLAASDTILALVLVGVLILQAGQWYAQKKEAAEIEEIEKQDQEEKKTRKGKESKKKQ
ncbi:Shr3 amino acid permease chaperone [Myriangium duriaei CBS 260.36]|uniref:Shr3 amino acid permease chaperone n=1 Tax=Myriangium duriaei CBS 260.36 TaxID=1168546 RepID=A0A9P4JDG3_9PEZI|nr:Shr3 amino acid permease chaperone [Myriangium duriaei CBS 260.36]